MAVVPRKLSTGAVTYYVAFTWQGKRIWERVGADKREAMRADARRKAEVRAGTYVPRGATRATTVAQWARGWFERRDTRNDARENSNVERYVLSREWFASKSLQDVGPRDMLQFIEELKVTVSEVTKRPLSSKSVRNIYGTLRTMFRDAHVAEVITRDPCVLPRGSLKGKGKKRAPYEVHELRALVTTPETPIDHRMWALLAFFTGMREGEVCGRRWRDWDRNVAPLGSLTVDSQYDNQPLKTEDAAGDRPRIVPVHPTLARALEWWHREGWEFVYCRKPKPDDFIVPRRDGTAHTGSTAYKAWIRSTCPRAGVANRSLHSTRHTFISLARRGGARKEVVERITHNAEGDIVDAYTHWDWAPLCEAVSCIGVDLDVDQIANTATFEGTGGGSRTPGPIANAAELPGTAPSGAPSDDAVNSASEPPPTADRDAHQRSTSKGLKRQIRKCLDAALSGVPDAESRTHREMRKALRMMGLTGGRAVR